MTKGSISSVLVRKIPLAPVEKKKKLYYPLLDIKSRNKSASTMIITYSRSLERFPKDNAPESIIPISECKLLNLEVPLYRRKKWRTISKKDWEVNALDLIFDLNFNLGG